MTPSVSIVIPVYNTEAYLRECLDSVFGQSLHDIEVICVDDCSTDSSPDILAEYAGKETRLRTFRQPRNMKPGAARNLGLEMAGGRYVFFMDSDDLFASKTILQELVQTADANDLDLMVFSADSFIDGDFRQDKTETVKKLQSNYLINDSICNTVSTGPKLLASMLQKKCYSPCIWLRLFRTRRLRDHGIGFLPDNLHEDSLFTPLAHFAARRSMAISSICINRRIRPGSIMTESAIGIKRFQDTYAIAKEWMNTPVPDSLDGADRDTWMRISARLLGHVCKFFCQITESEQKDKIILDGISAPGHRLYAACLLHNAGKQKKIESLTEKNARLRHERDCARKEKAKTQKKISSLEEKLKKLRKERDARPNSITGCITFIFRRIKKRSLSAFWGQARTRT